MLADLAAAFASVLQWQVLLSIASGTVAGLVIGAIPGLSVTMAMALLVPITFFMDPIIGITFLIGLYKGGTFGGAVASILIGTPGTASNAATLLDGYPMAQKGEGGRAILGGLYASLIGDFFGSVALVFGAPLLALIALRFGFPEYVALVCFSLTMVCFISGNSLAKGLLAASVGLFFGLIGTDPIGGSPRLTFGLEELQRGIHVVPLAIGIFALSEVFVQVERLQKGRALQAGAQIMGKATIRWHDLTQNMRTIVRSSAIGTLIGALPGIGAETSSWVAYGLAKRASRQPEKFGTGTLEGVMAPEAANNAVCGSAMIPMLVFGIPGDVVTVFLMSALIAQGLHPGPSLIADNREVFYGLFISVFLATCALFIFGRLTLRYWVWVLAVPMPLLYGVVVVLCVVGTYGVSSSFFDVFIMLGFGVLGYIMRRLDIALPPLILAFVLSNILENSLRRGLVQADGNYLIFFERPIAAVFIGLSAAVLLSVFWGELKRLRRRRQGRYPRHPQ